MPAVMDAAQPRDGAAADGERFSPAILDSDRIHDQIEQSLVKKVRKLVEDFPERALEVIRGWMAEGG